MKICIVGNGPSAEGRGAEIDACDFVVRMKAFWAHGAVDAGDRIDAWVHYGDVDAMPKPFPQLQCQHWLSHCSAQLRVNRAKVKRLTHWRRLSRRLAPQYLRRRLRTDLWQECVDALDHHPSTGFVAVAMAMEICRPAGMLLVGLDSTTPDAPHYHNARHEWDTVDVHRYDLEKAALVAIRDGRWLGRETSTQLDWIGEPLVVR